MPKAKTERKTARTQAKPTRKRRATDSKDLPPVSANTSVAPSPLGPSSTGAVLFRTLCIENVREYYPGIEARNDFDLIELSGHHYKGTPAETYAALDEQLAQDVEDDGYEFTMDACTKTLNTNLEPTGIKPKESVPDDKLVFVRPIPDSKYSFRLFPGSLTAAEYCMDFVETSTGKPVNSPFEYELWGIPNPDADTPWLSIPMVGKLRTLERAYGVKQADPEPGAEKYALRDGQTCHVLVRPGKRSLRFTVPVRKVKNPVGVDNMDVAELPRYIEL